MKVLVTGWRSWPQSKAHLIEERLTALDPDIVVHGGAAGADSIAGRWALKNHADVRVYPANWSYYGRAAGSKRNQQMIDAEHLPGEPIDLVLAFVGKGSVGTLNMIEKARAAGLPVEEIHL